MPTPVFSHASGSRSATAKLDRILPSGFASRPNLVTTPLPPGVGLPRVRGYEILSVIGSGGMGIVYEARHRELNRRVAIKTLRWEALADPEFRTRFRAEAEAIARLQHPNIIQVFEIGTVEPLPGEVHPAEYIALEYVEGGSLAQRTQAPQPPREVARLVEAIARATHAVHQLGIVHRDLKPANVLLTHDGVPKIADFGIAKQLEPAAGADRPVTCDGRVLGTPEYLAPEQLYGGAVTPTIDVYALGVILYELFTARVPFQGETFADTMVLATRQEPVPPSRLQPGIPRDLETICLKCLEKAPERRYESAEALADDLARWAAGQPIRARAVGPVERAWRRARRNPAVAALSAAVLLVAVTGLAGIVWGWGAARRHATESEANAAAAIRELRRAETATELERVERHRVSIVAASGALQLYDVNAARRALSDIPPEARGWVWNQLHAQLDRSRAALPVGREGHANGFTRDGRFALFTGNDWSVRVWDTVDLKECTPPGLGPNATRAVLSSDGRVLAHAPLGDHTVRLCDRATGRTRAVLRGHTGAVLSIDLSPDATRVTTTADDGTLRTWDGGTGKQVGLFRTPPEAGAPMVLSPNGRVVAARGKGSAPVAYAWDLETGRKLATFGGHELCVHAVHFSPNGDRLVTLEQFPANAVRLWDVATGRCLATFRGHENQVTDAAFSPDGSRLLTPSVDRTIGVWDVSPSAPGGEPHPVFELRGHLGTVNHAAFSPDGRLIVSSSNDRTVRCWNARTGRPVAVLCGHTGEVSRSAFRADGTLASAALDGTIRVWDAAGTNGGSVIRGHEWFAYSVAFFPDGERVASGAWDGTARVWNPTTGRELSRFDHGDERYVTSVAVDPTGRHLATLARAEGRDERSVRLWDAGTGALLARWEVHNGWQDGRVAFSPSGDLLATGSADGRVHLWDVATRTPVAVLECGVTPVRDVQFGPDGKLLAAGCDDGDNTVRIWDVAARKQVRVLSGHARGVYALAWNRSGTLLASGSYDQSVRVWDTTTWATVDEVNHGAIVYGVAFTPDERLLACACFDNLIRVRDVSTRRELAELSGHDGYVHHLAFSPDGTRMVSASEDKTLRVWDTVPKAERVRR